MTDGTRAAFGGFIGAVIGFFLMDGMGVAVGVAVGVSLGVLLGADREWSGPEMPQGLRRSVAPSAIAVANQPLRQQEETIQQRLGEIGAREKRLVETRQRVMGEAGGELETERWQRVAAAIDSAYGILASQRERYHAKLWEIALVRWQNTLEPLASDWESLTHETCNHRLRLLENARDRGAAFLKDWEGVDVSDIPEARNCVNRLRDSLETCDQLREQLIIQQATLAVKGIAPLSEALHPTLVPSEALRAMDTFNARASIGEFSTAFGELEAEYSRLRSEEELAERAVLVQRVH